MTEADRDVAIQTIHEVARFLCKKYAFPGQTEEDLMQIALMEGLDAWHRCDPERPLRNFLAVHIKRRLLNYRRDNYIRMEKPCNKCPLKAYIPPNGCSAYANKMDCSFYERWFNKNRERQNINNAIDFSIVSDVNEKSMSYDLQISDDIDQKELLEFIDYNIPIDMRKIYLIFMHGGKVSAAKQEALFQIIRELIYDSKKVG